MGTFVIITLGTLVLGFIILVAYGSRIKANGGLPNMDEANNPEHTIINEGGLGKANLFSDGRVTMDFNIPTAVGGHRQNMAYHFDTTIEKIQEGTKRHEAEKSRLIKKYGSGDIIELPEGMVRVKHDYLRSRYIKGAIISDDLLFADADDAGYVTIKRAELDDMEARLNEYNKKYHNSNIK